jgi:hypothetical protein
VLAFALGVWFLVVRRAYGKWVAVLTLLFTVVSCPYFYHLNARTLPNFPEAFLIGGLILLSYDSKRLGWVGFFCGFGAYVFSIVIYYPLAIFLSLAKPLSIRKIFYPCLVVMAFGFLTLVTGFDSFQFRGQLIKWDPLSTLFWSSLPILIDYVFAHCWPPNKKFLLGCGLGYLPALYAKLILGIHSTKAVGIGGGLEALKDRFHYFYFGQQHFFNGRIYFILGFLIYLFVAPKKSPLYALFFGIVAIFFTSQVVVDELSSRYLIFLVSVYAMGTAWTLVHLWKFKKVRIPAIVFAISFLVSNAFALKTDIESDGGKVSWEKKISVLNEAKIDRGFADYWYAYAINLLTNERIILEPVGSNYSPHYGPIVKAKSEIGYLAHKSHWPSHDEKVISLYERTYFIKSSVDVDPLTRLYVLEMKD